MARARYPFPASPTDELVNQLNTLERRLEDGYARIDAARREGEDIAAWEAFWVELLHQYEAVCDGLVEKQAA